MKPSYLLWGLFFLSWDLATLFLVQKGREEKSTKIVFQEKKLMKSKWWKSCSFALMKVAGYTNWGSYCNWNIMMLQSCTRNREMSWLIEERESKVSVERNAKWSDRFAAQFGKDALIRQEHVLFMMSDTRSEQPAQQPCHNWGRTGPFGGQSLQEGRLRRSLYSHHPQYRQP